jgi:hypothetical protein
VLGRPLRIVKQHHELVQTIGEQFSPAAMHVFHHSTLERLIIGEFWDPTAAVPWLDDKNFSAMQRRFYAISQQHSNLNFDTPQHDDGKTRIISPLAWTAERIRAYTSSYVPNVAGMGMLFGPTLILSLATMLLQLSLSLKSGSLTAQQRLCFYLAAATFASVLAYPLVWMSRYVPQVWLVPIFAATTCLAGAQTRAWKLVLAGALCAMLATNLMIVESAYWNFTWQRNAALRQGLADARQANRNSHQPLSLYQSEFFGAPPVGGIARRLAESGISYVKTDRAPNTSERCFRVTDNPIVLYEPEEHK